MNSSETNDLIEAGLTMGIYLIATLIADGHPVSTEAARALQRSMADSIETNTGIPAEDFAAMVGTNMDRALKSILEEHDGE